MDNANTIIDGLLREGLLAAKAGQPCQAREIFLRAIHEDRGRDLTWLCLASVTESLQLRLYYLNRVIELNPQDDRGSQLLGITRIQFSEELVGKATVALRAGDSGAAVHCLLHAVELNPRNESAWLGLAQLEDPPETPEMLLERVLEIDPDNTRARILLGEARAKGIATQALDSSTCHPPDVDVCPVEAALEQVESAEEPSLALEAQTAEDEPVWTAPESQIDTIEEVAGAAEPLIALDKQEEEEAEQGWARSEAPLTLEIPAEAMDPVVDASHLESLPDPTAETKVAALPLTQLRQCPFCDAPLAVNIEECGECHGLLSLNAFVTGSSRAGSDSNRRQTLLAAARYNRALSSNPNDAATCYKLGLAYLNLRHPDAALRALQRASDLRPDAELGGVLEWLKNLKEQRAAQAPRGLESHPPAQRNQRPILVVDDSPTVRKAVMKTLEKYGYLVVSAVDGQDALSKVGKCKPSLVFLDITMPKLDGYQVCKTIRETNKSLPVVMLSGKDGFFDKVRGKVAGSTAYITKPFEARTIVETAERYCPPG